MSQPHAEPLHRRGTISRLEYFAIGFALTFVKLTIDFLVATGRFGRSWSLLNYALASEVGGLFSLDHDEQVFYATMLAVALPFVVVGLVLTIRRLRDAGWPLWLAACFFAPMPINVVFFIVLSFVPTRSPREHGGLEDVGDVPELPKAGDADLIAAHIRGDALGEVGAKPAPYRHDFSFFWALGAILIPLPFAAILTYVMTYVLLNYGWTLFVGLPFVLPMLSVVVYGFRRDLTVGQSLAIGWLWLAIALVALIAFAYEGLICIVMMLPLAVPIVLLGAYFGYCIVALGSRRRGDLWCITFVLVALAPTMVGAEYATTPEPLRFTCETSVVVDAPPAVVWRNVVSFADLDPPNDWLFHTGVAYPIRARIEGTGVGAIRRCEFSTGAFVEPIEVWDEPRLLRFAVTSNPAPMREWNPFYEIHPPHLDGFLVAKHGQFELTELSGGRTLLKGRTLYQHGLWPAAYWRLWSDPIIHRIHDRVLRHIKRLSEAPGHF